MAPPVINPADPTNQFTSVGPRYFQGGKAVFKCDPKDPSGFAGLGDILGKQRARLRGVVPSARLPMAVQPAAADFVTVGAQVVEFVATSSPPVPVLNPNNVAVFRGASAAAALANLVTALNGVVDGVNVAYPAGYVAPSIVADAVDATHLRIRNADKAGGTPVAGVSAGLALAQSITGGSPWSVANLNVSGKVLADQDISTIKVLVTPEMVAYGTCNIELPFAPTIIIPGGDNPSAAFSISGTTVVVAMKDAALTPFFNAGDTIVALAIA